MDAVKAQQVGGDHYRQQKFQPIEYIMGNNLGFCEGNVVKYVSRWKSKGGVQDLKKARQYLDFLIEEATRGNKVDGLDAVLMPGNPARDRVEEELNRMRGRT